MPPAVQQYTPSQILEAGRRAEAEGRTEYAIQFYRHLIDNHVGAPEAEAAHDALVLIQARRGGDTPPPPPGMNGAQVRGGPPPVPGEIRPARPGGISLALLGAERPLPLALPARRNAYRTGRLIARLLTWAGGLTLLAAIAATAALKFAPNVLANVPQAQAVLEWLAHPILAPAAAAGGVLAMLAGQIARAVLEQANASCDLAATARAEAEHRADTIAVQARD
jgi:hypothetical protein